MLQIIWIETNTYVCSECGNRRLINILHPGVCPHLFSLGIQWVYTYSGVFEVNFKFPHNKILNNVVIHDILR